MQTVGPVWVEVDLDRIAENTRTVRGLIGERRLMAVVKGDAYGHGAVETARTVLANGATDLAVTTLYEALELRQAGIAAPILVFNGMLPADADAAVAADLTCNVFTRESAAALSAAAVRAGGEVRVHIEVDTGMARYGVPGERAVAFIEECRALPGLVVEGVFTHFVAAHRADRRTATQFSKFMQVVTELAARGIDIPLKHAANSEAVLLLPETWLDMVRVGNLLYGLYPVDRPPGGPDLKSAWKLKARVLNVMDVPAGTPIGYGPDYVTRRPLTVATVPVGYADGAGVEPLSRSLHLPMIVRSIVATVAGWFKRSAGFFSLTRGLVTFDGRELPVLGRIAMQQLIVDATGRQLSIGDTVQVNLRRTIVSPRIPKVYLADGRPVMIRTVLGETSLRGGAAGGTGDGGPESAE